ncbi:MAG: RNA polymerase sigma factor [Bacteroidota bacterium]
MNHLDFLDLIAPFKDKVYRLAKRLLISREEAEDALQEVIVKLWNKNESLSDVNNVEAFAMSMTKNYCLDQLKSKRAGNLQIAHTNYADRSTGLQQQFEDNDSLRWVEKIINELPEQQKIIVQLRDIEQYEFSAIADLLDMNETAVRVALSRARKSIRESLIKTHQYGIEQH